METESGWFCFGGGETRQFQSSLERHFPDKHSKALEKHPHADPEPNLGHGSPGHINVSTSPHWSWAKITLKVPVINIYSTFHLPSYEPISWQGRLDKGLAKIGSTRAWSWHQGIFHQFLDLVGDHCAVPLFHLGRPNPTPPSPRLRSLPPLSCFTPF